jgi:DNA invertase Pin-like site-specific DNA recombinase
MASIGYARVSTKDQDHANQTATLTEAGCERVFSEKITGARADRPALTDMFACIRPGDLVIVTRLDRLARNTRDLLDIAERLQKTGVGLKSLAEPWADTTSPAGKMLLTILAGVAEFERTLIVARTTEGRIAARKKGVKFGAPPKCTPEKLETIRAAIANGMPVAKATRAVGIHPSTYYRALLTN